MSTSYNRTNPFFALLKDRYSLTQGNSVKKTYHLILDIKNSSIKYKVGDSIGILAFNHSNCIKKILNIMQVSGEEPTLDKRKQEKMAFKDFLIKKANISQVPISLVRYLEEKLPKNSQKQNEIKTLLLPENKSHLKEYIEKCQLWDFLEQHKEVKLSPQEVAAHLLPLMPRFYSIACSQTVFPDEVHLTVGFVEYMTLGHQRLGVGSHYLCTYAKSMETKVPIYLLPSKNFTLPEDKNAPIIMIGPGTGIAPYRGFMQERLKTGATEKNWLFFGECYKKHDYYYGDYWEELKNKNLINLSLAFSRDQKEKCYVQHKMQENSKELWDWIDNKGAYIYVCGDAFKMAKDVDATLHKIVENEGRLSTEDAKSYLKELRKNKRYLKDVY